jgi:ubiquinone/menaquinone biosynthesis C-methylase UbiE
LQLISKKKGVTMAGIDISPQMLHIAGEKLGKQADIRLGDSEELPWEDNSFDVVVCINSFHHFPNPQKELKEMHRVLRQEGLLILADPWLTSPVIQVSNLLIRLIASRIYGDFRLYTELDIRRLLEECQFKSIEWERAGKTAHLFNLRPLACVVTARASK